MHDTDLGVQGQRVAIEAIASLVHIRDAMADLILKPAGVPPDVYRSLLSRRDQTTGRLLSKRQLAPLILDAVAKRPDCSGVVRAIVEIAARWSAFHLAGDEFAARATVQKAREVLRMLELVEAKDAEQRAVAELEEAAQRERERATRFARESELLLSMFDELAKDGEPHRRGYLLQDLLNRLFDLHAIPVFRSFTRNQGGEQIDGAFKLEGWYYVVECRWRNKLSDIRDLDGLKGQVDRSGKQTMGLFLSMEGWSSHVPQLLKQNPDKSIVLMHGYDLRAVLSGQVEDLRDFITAKVGKLNLEAEPYLDVREYLRSRANRALSAEG